MPAGSTNVHPNLRMTIPTSRTFMNDFVFLFSEFSDFCDFSAQREGVAKEMGEKKRRGRETERNVRTPQPYVTVGRRITEFNSTNVFSYSESRGRRISKQICCWAEREKPK